MGSIVKRGAAEAAGLLYLLACVWIDRFSPAELAILSIWVSGFSLLGRLMGDRAWSRRRARVG